MPAAAAVTTPTASPGPCRRAPPPTPQARPGMRNRCRAALCFKTGGAWGGLCNTGRLSSAMKPSMHCVGWRAVQVADLGLRAFRKLGAVVHAMQGPAEHDALALLFKRCCPHVCAGQAATTSEVACTPALCRAAFACDAGRCPRSCAAGDAGAVQRRWAREMGQCRGSFVCATAGARSVPRGRRAG